MAAGREYVAMYDFQARTRGDLGFYKGDILELVSSADPNWWQARNKSGQVGAIPSNYVKQTNTLAAEDWFHGKLSRTRAELLIRQGPLGSFLVRNSESKKGYAITAKSKDGNINNFRVKEKKHSDGSIEYHISKQQRFNSLVDLINHHKRNAVGEFPALGIPAPHVDVPQTVGLGRDTWEIPRDSILLDKRLGQGQFGEVYKGTWNKTTPVAVKTLKPGTMEKEAFLKEANLMKNMRHPKLLQLLAVCTESEPMYIVLELMKNGSLLDYLHEKGRALDIHILIDISLQVAVGMAYLESKNFIHRDLAARNVLVGDNNVCKIADFGLARAIETDLYVASEGSKMPVKWSAPEAVQYSKFSIKSDVWSYGILLTEIVTHGRIPYPGMPNQKVIEKVERGYRMEKPVNCPQLLYDLMLDCWKMDPVERPTFESIQWRLEEYYEESSYRDADSVF
eukprot:m.71161 g.71161  ORF g.71161 m.71161 type:complete len:451 (+) comp12217_c0_seq2:321-1673(+)